ncbi:MAG TPA: ABC transporter substrate-binding protein [Candidatus Methylomirabilis sp.]|nr:ABC transporter substrate-binding protein [Candidatus Methylomirabilis sp.]
MPILTTRTARLIFAACLSAAAVHGLHPVEAAKIVALKSADVDVYNEVLEGFDSSFPRTTISEYDMEGDFQKGRKFLARLKSGSRPDLILAIGIWALQVVVEEIRDIPVVFAMVLNPTTVIGQEAHNITGASMNVPIEQQIALLKKVSPQVRRIGVIYDPSKTGFLVRQAERIARDQGVRLVTKAIASSKDSFAALDAMQGEIDALWILPDLTVLAPESVQYMLLFSFRNKIPLLGLSENQARMGALLGLSFESGRDIGSQAAELANAILSGKSAGELPITAARKVRLTVNLKTAGKLGLQIPNEILEQADVLIR